MKKKLDPKSPLWAKIKKSEAERLKRARVIAGRKRRKPLKKLNKKVV